MFYDRKIKYIHMYEKDEKRQNVGFVKLEAVEDKVSVYVQVAGLRRVSEEECLVKAKGEEAESVLGKIFLKQGKGSLDIKDLAIEQVAERIPYDELREIFVNLPVGVELRCVIRESCEKEREEISERRGGVQSEEIVYESVEENIEKVEELSEAELLRETFVQERRMLEENAYESKAENGDEMSEEKPISVRVRPQVVQAEGAEETMGMAADKWQQLWNLYPHMKPFEDGREYLVVKPQDFVILQNKYYTLSANSFLLHGYYNYEHLILCRETKRESECFYIGVPGNFYEKEKRVAVLFGFESFEGKREPAGNGDFGYYMVKVEI